MSPRSSPSAQPSDTFALVPTEAHQSIPAGPAAIVGRDAGPHNGHTMGPPGQPTAFPVLPYGPCLTYPMNVPPVGGPGFAVPVPMLMQQHGMTPHQFAQLQQQFVQQSQPIIGPLPGPRPQIPVVHVEWKARKRRRPQNPSTEQVYMLTPGSENETAVSAEPKARSNSVCTEDSAASSAVSTASAARDATSKTSGEANADEPLKRCVKRNKGRPRSKKTKSVIRKTRRQPLSKRSQLPTPPNERSPELPQARQPRLSPQQSPRQSPQAQSPQSPQLQQPVSPTPPGMLVEFTPFSPQANYRYPSPALPHLIPVTHVPTAKRRKRKPTKTPWRLASSPEASDNSEGSRAPMKLESPLQSHTTPAKDDLARDFVTKTSKRKGFSAEPALRDYLDSDVDKTLAKTTQSPSDTDALQFAYNCASPRQPSRSRRVKSLPTEATTNTAAATPAANATNATTAHDEDFMESMHRQSQQWSMKLRQLRRWVQAKEDALNERRRAWEQQHPSVPRIATSQ